MKSDKTVYRCGECGYQSGKWYGRCPSCGEYNTFEETVIAASKGTSQSASTAFRVKGVRLGELETPDYIRVGSGMEEFDRVIGGGIVCGSAILLSGEPGIGKSTLLLQTAGELCKSGKNYGVIGIFVGEKPIDSFDESIVVSVIGECG